MGCNEKKDKKQLLRIVLNKEGVVKVDVQGNKEGRGAYICQDINCLEKVIKTKRLERLLEVKLDEKIYNEIRGVIIDKSEQNKKD